MNIYEWSRELTSLSYKSFFDVGHGTIRAAILPEIISKIMERYQLSEDAALDRFYRSATGASFADDETGLYGQSPNYIFGLFAQEMSERG